MAAARSQTPNHRILEFGGFQTDSIARPSVTSSKKTAHGQQTCKYRLQEEMTNSINLLYKFA